MENYKNKKLTYEDLEDISIYELRLSQRPINCLKRYGIVDFAHVITLTHEELWRMRNMGAKSIKEIYEVIEAFDNEEITPNMKIIDAHTIGMDEAEKKEYTSRYYDKLLKMDLSEIGMWYSLVEDFKKLGINSIEELVLSNKVKKLKSSYVLERTGDLLSKFGLHLGMTRDELDKLVSINEKSNYTNKEGHYAIEEFEQDIKKENEKLKIKNEEDSIVLDLLKKLDDPNTDDNMKEALICIIDDIKENRDLKSRNEKINEDIDAYINKLERSSHFIEERFKIKRKNK